MIAKQILEEPDPGYLWEFFILREFRSAGSGFFGLHLTNGDSSGARGQIFLRKCLVERTGAFFRANGYKSM